MNIFKSERILCIVLLIFAIGETSCQKFQTNDKEIVIDTVNGLFIGVDERDWSKVKQSFDNSVLLDYSSMTGGKPVTLHPDKIIDSWKGVLPGFDKTHHQIGNYLVSVDNQKAKVFCYGTATHFLDDKSNNHIWTVVGTYDFELIKIADKWNVTKMKFNLKYIDGNKNLPAKAMERMKKTKG